MRASTAASVSGSARANRPADGARVGVETKGGHPTNAPSPLRACDRISDPRMSHHRSCGPLSAGRRHGGAPVPRSEKVFGRQKDVAAVRSLERVIPRLVSVDARLSAARSEFRDPCAQE